MHILLVEDAICSEVVVATLRKQGHEVTSALSGADALALLETGFEPDLLLTDVQLPGEIDGWLLAHFFKDEIPELPVVYMTATRGEIDQVTNSIYLLKPVRPSLLTQAVETIGRVKRYLPVTRTLH